MAVTMMRNLIRKPKRWLDLHLIQIFNIHMITLSQIIQSGTLNVVWWWSITKQKKKHKLNSGKKSTTYQSARKNWGQKMNTKIHMFKKWFNLKFKKTLMQRSWSNKKLKYLIFFGIISSMNTRERLTKKLWKTVDERGREISKLTIPIDC